MFLGGSIILSPCPRPFGGRASGFSGADSLGVKSRFGVRSLLVLPAAVLRVIRVSRLSGLR